LRPAASRISVAILAAFVVWLFREPLLGGAVLYARDIHLVWHAQIEGFVRAVAAGCLPLWDPSPSFGQRLLADPGAQVLYPPTWLNLSLHPWTYYSLFAAGHFLLAALGMRALARRWGLSFSAATLAAVLWILSGPFWSLTDLWHHFASAAWMPLVLLAADRACASGRLRDAAAAGLVFGLQILAGSADMCALTVVTGALVLAWRHGRVSKGRASWLRLGRTALVLLGTAGLLSAGVWIPALAALHDATRSEFPMGIRTYWSVHPVSLVELVVPEPFLHLPLRSELRAALYENREPLMASLYLGLPGLALAAAALVQRRDTSSSEPESRGWRGPLAVASASAVVLALGRHTPLFALVGAAIPPLRILRYPVKIMVVAGFGFSMLAGAGLDAWSGERPARPRLWALVTVAFAALTTALVVAALLIHERPDLAAAYLSAAPRGVAPALLLAPLRARVDAAVALGSASVLLMALRSWRSRAWIAPLLAVLAVADLAWWHRDPNPTAPRSLYTYRPPIVDAIGDPSAARVYVYDYTIGDEARRLLGHESPYVLTRIPEGWTADAALALAMQETLAGEVPGRFGLRQAYEADYRGLQSRATALLGALLRRAERTDPAEYLRLLQLGGVTHVVARHEDHAGLRLVGRYESLLSEPTLLYRVPDTLPRCLLLTGVRVASPLGALRQMADPTFDPHREVLLPTGEARPADPSFQGHVRRCEAGPDWMRVETHADREAYLLLTESFAPGWRATIDGEPAPVLPANAAFRAVAVPAGRHTVRLRYAPPAARVGLTLSALTALLALTVLAALAIARGRARVGPSARDRRT
jgi:hypothetical protein